MHLITLKLGDRITVQADEVLVDRIRREPVFIPLEAFPEIELGHEFAPHEQVQCPIDRRFTDVLTVRPEHALDFIDRQMFTGPEDDLGHGLSLVGDRQPLLSEEASEEPDEGG